MAYRAVMRVFISHASKDKALIDLFSEHVLRLGLQIGLKDIFCSSLDGAKIKTGEDFRKAIRDALLGCEVVLLIITPHYKQSEMCLNEMGAAWTSDKTVVPLMVDPINYRSVGALMKPKQIAKIADKDHLDELRDQLLETLGLPGGSTSDWNKQVRRFQRGLSTLLSKTEFDKPVDPKEFEQLVQERDELSEEVQELDEQVSTLEARVRELEGLKDREQVAEVQAKYEDSTLADQFEHHCGEVKDALAEFDPVVGAVILCRYHERPYSPYGEAYERELNEACRRGVLDGDDFSPKRGSKRVQGLHQALDALDSFVS
ncbi:MAG: TIR domain-containing protein, partial [Deltaproteobacteria bacterium]|nr:TIR domain-containing protein [Deltaproteobacteria bacterium]